MRCHLDFPPFFPFLLVFFFLPWLAFARLRVSFEEINQEALSSREAGRRGAIYPPTFLP